MKTAAIQVKKNDPLNLGKQLAETFVMQPLANTYTPGDEAFDKALQAAIGTLIGAFAAIYGPDHATALTQNYLELIAELKQKATTH
ncbi:hypothetical protein DJFAAGMI_01892 [Comamonas sp. PE63]|uniref:Uncharacterized protein n=1 Tax=Comamonas brasiliensis TaxID=1812482 RepID=A0ABS5LRM9_9BURK|nr:hypothetical protein [Comamonas sp. PE63]MBS3019153.1 hypothetical protein [Comamonas sp. PE63]